MNLHQIKCARECLRVLIKKEAVAVGNAADKARLSRIEMQLHLSELLRQRREQQK